MAEKLTEEPSPWQIRRATQRIRKEDGPTFDLIFDEEVKRASDLERERQREEILKMKSSRER